MRFKREYTLTGTLDDFVRELGDIPEDQIEIMESVNEHMILEAITNRYGFYVELYKLILDKEVLYDESWGNHKNIRYVDSGFIANAGDSLITRMYADQQFKSEMKIKLSCDGNNFSFEVEDNGTGIDSEIESSIFSINVHSKKRSSNLYKAYIGRQGTHMYSSRVNMEELGGTIHFENKGHKKGARFWYQVPVEALKQQFMQSLK